MSVYNKTPMARKAAWSYCRRCLAVMLCCVLAFGFAVPTAPRASANAAVEAVTIVGAGGGSAGAVALGSNPVGATICGLLLAVVGVDFAAGYFEHDSTKYYSDGVYKLGGQCWDYLYNLGGDIADWCINRSSSDVLPGSSFDVPPEVLEAVRQWAVSNIDFTDGAVVYNAQGIFTADGSIVFTQNPASVPGSIDVSTITTFGSLYPTSASWNFDFVDGAGANWSYTIGPYEVNENQYVIRILRDGSENVLSPNNKAGAPYAFFWACDYAGVPYLGYGVIGYGKAWFFGPKSNTDKGKYMSIPVGSVFGAETTLTDTPALEEEKTAPIAVTVPSSAPTTTVGDLTIPVFGDLTAGDLTGEKEDENNKPGTVTAPWDKVLDGLDGINDKVGALSGEIAGAVSGAMSDALADSMAGVIAKADAQQQTVENSIAEPDDLGAIFISKFPFSIPWDIFKFFSLLAAEPVTPHWEIDFYAPLEGVGGFHAQGDTTLVIDFENLEFMGQVCRWTCLAGFVYALASGTKKLIWTS